MSETFDPYHVWLGIPPLEQPANHYRLLTVPLFESDPEVVDNAADRQSAHLRNYQSGKHGRFAERLLNEVAAARVCLLDPRKKAAYDQQLRARLTTQSAATLRRPPQPPPPVLAPAISTSAGPAQAAATTSGPAPAAIAPLASVESQTDSDWDNLLGKSESHSHQVVGDGRSIQRKTRGRGPSLFAAAALLLIAAGGVGLFALSRGSADGAVTFNWPPPDRDGATLTVDGVRVPIPTTGPWEYRCAAGEHQVAARRSGYRPWNTTVAIAPGQPQAVAFNWTPAAVLTLAWALEDRKGADLTIDGRHMTISEQAPIEFPVEPGNRIVRIVRPGVEPLEINVAIVSDARKTIPVSPISAQPVPASISDVEATLVIRLPADQRINSIASIDGQVATAGKSDDQGMEYKLKTGQHTIRITRPGFQPFRKVVDLASSGNPPLVPIWRPIPTRAKPPVTRPKATVPNVTVPNVVKSPAVETLKAVDAQPVNKQPVLAVMRSSA